MLWLVWFCCETHENIHNLFNPSGYSRLLQNRFSEPAGLLLLLSFWPVRHTHRKDYIGLMDVGENMHHLTREHERHGWISNTCIVTKRAHHQGCKSNIEYILIILNPKWYILGKTPTSPTNCTELASRDVSSSFCIMSHIKPLYLFSDTSDSKSMLGSSHIPAKSPAMHVIQNHIISWFFIFFLTHPVKTIVSPLLGLWVRRYSISSPARWRSTIQVRVCSTRGAFLTGFLG